MVVPNPEFPGGEQIKILDFGIAKMAELESGISEAHTRADALLGTPKYMSPEQCRGGGGVESKSDVYSLGVIFFELLSGQPPFAGSAHGELIVQHIMQEPPPLASLTEPGTPEPLLALIHRMLTKDKGLRPTMRQAAGELDQMGGFMSGMYGTLPQGAASSMHGLGSFYPTPPPGSVTGSSSVPGAQSLPGYTNHAGGQTLPSHPGMTPLPGGPQAAPPSTLGLSAGQLPGVAPRRFPLSIAIGGLLGAIAVSVLLVVSMKKPPLPPPPPPRPVIQTPPPVSPPPPAPPKVVHWAVVTVPEGAMVIRQRDGQVLGITPLSMTKEAASGAEQVRIVLAGYVDMPLTLSLEQDADQKIDLRPKGGHDKKIKGPAKNSKKNGKGYVPSDLTVVD